MKALLAAVLFPIIFLAESHAESKPAYYSMEWLELGMASVVFVLSPNAKVSPTQEQWATDSMLFYSGFIKGINYSRLIASNGDAPLFEPDDYMDSIKDAAPKIIAFINSNKKSINPNATAQEILMAWYLFSHSKSTVLDRAKATALLESDSELKGSTDSSQPSKSSSLERLRKLRDDFSRNRMND